MIDLRHRAQGAERMQREFLSRVGHELRTPLTVIRGYAELLNSREVAPIVMRDWHERILEQARRLQRIIEMLEFLAASEAGRAPLYREPGDVAVLVDAVVTRWASTLPEGSINPFVDPNLPDVNVDARWLSFSIDELIGNAVEYAPDGSPITVTAVPIPGGRGPGVEITVRDRGPGMTPEAVERAFDAFVQGDASDTRGHGGLGLGLVLVKRVVEGHDGDVTVVSNPGQGLTFSIRIGACGAAAVTRRPSE